MNITFLELVLRNFKSHKELLLAFSEITRILGTNGAGKSSIGEAVTWTLYGVDTLGNTLTKALSPEPTNYEYDRVEGHLLLEVDGVPIRISRMIEKGKMLYFINDVPKKATEFDEFIKSLFNKNLFLSLFNPTYFFTQKWDEQRAQLLQYVPQPTNKEVLQKLTNLYLDTLTPLLKKKSITDLEAQHKDNKNRKDKDIIFLSGQVKAIRDDYKQAPEPEAGAIEKLQVQLAAVEKELGEASEKDTAHIAALRVHDMLRTELDSIKSKADGVKEQYTKVKNTPVSDSCELCAQALTEEARQASLDHFNTQLIYMREGYSELVAKHKEIKAKLEAVVIPEYEPIDFQAIHRKRADIENQINKLNDRAILAAKLADAEAKEQEARDSHNESTLILDAIKAFKAAEANLMAQKIAGLFPTLTLELYQENKGDGERKPYFEVYQDGKPYRKLSQAESVKAGLELIDVLSSQSGIIAPVFIDGAESIIKYKAPAGQLIECRVQDEPLNIQSLEVV